MPIRVIFPQGSTHSPLVFFPIEGSSLFPSLEKLESSLASVDFRSQKTPAPVFNIHSPSPPVPTLFSPNAPFPLKVPLSPSFSPKPKNEQGLNCHNPSCPHP